MYGSGAGIGTMKIIIANRMERVILGVLIRALPACYAAAAGAAIRGTVVLPVATASGRRTVATASVSAWPAVFEAVYTEPSYEQGEHRQ